MFSIQLDKRLGLATVSATLPPQKQVGKKKITIEEARAHLQSQGHKENKLVSGRNASNMDCDGQTNVVFIFSLLDNKAVSVPELVSESEPEVEVRRPRRRVQKKEG